jgi:hypothetical protein
MIDFYSINGKRPIRQQRVALQIHELGYSRLEWSAYSWVAGGANSGGVDDNPGPRILDTRQRFRCLELQKIELDMKKTGRGDISTPLRYKERCNWRSS